MTISNFFEVKRVVNFQDAVWYTVYHGPWFKVYSVYYTQYDVLYVQYTAYSELTVLT